MSYACSCETAQDKTLKVGSKVHRTKIFEGTRVGCAEEYFIAYISPHNVVFEAYRQTDGSLIGEIAMRRRDFEADYERCPGRSTR